MKNLEGSVCLCLACMTGLREMANILPCTVPCKRLKLSCPRSMPFPSRVRLRAEQGNHQNMSGSYILCSSESTRKYRFRLVFFLQSEFRDSYNR